MSTPDSSEAFHYSGADNLEVMTDAVNYNGWLADLVAQYCGGKGRILDFGAGTGTFAEMLRNRGLTVSCLEPDPTLAAMLSARGFETFRASEEIDDSTCEAIYSLNVMEHIAVDGAAAAELSRIVRPGGTVFVYVPAFPLLFGAMDRKVGHYRRYTRGSLCRLFRETGLVVDRSAYADSLGFLATLAFNLKRGDGSLNRRALIFYDRVIFPISRLTDLVVASLLGKNVWVALHKPTRILPGVGA